MAVPLNLLPGGENPLESQDSGVWDALIREVGPAGILVVIDGILGEDLRRRVSAEDVWQETLLHAWRDRSRCAWKGVPAFRRWLLSVARHRIHDLADEGAAAKRGGKRGYVPLEDALPPSGQGDYAGPVGTTTPRRAAMDRERAEMMISALASLPEDLRDVVRLGLFEDMNMEEVARRLGIHPQAARRRFRRGCEEYYRRIKSVLSTPPDRPRTSGGAAESSLV